MKILISQHVPSNLAPYEVLQNQCGAELDFHPFFLIEPLSAKEFRAEHINLPDYTAIVFSSRHAIDAYFKLCEEMRFKVPETMKYFCSTEAVAMYLQKHIVYRKRKIFFGDGTPQSVLNQIGTKHKGEKFLVTQSDSSNSGPLTRLMDAQNLQYQTAVLVKSVPQDLHDVDLSAYGLIVVYNPSDLVSLNENFPDYKPGRTRFITFGRQIAKAVDEAGLPVGINAPTPEIPSVAKAIEYCLEAGK